MTAPGLEIAATVTRGAVRCCAWLGHWSLGDTPIIVVILTAVGFLLVIARVVDAIRDAREVEASTREERQRRSVQKMQQGKPNDTKPNATNRACS